MFDGSSLEALEIQYLSIDVGIILFILRLRSNLLSGLALSFCYHEQVGKREVDYLGPKTIITKIIILTFNVKRGDFLEIRTQRTGFSMINPSHQHIRVEKFLENMHTVLTWWWSHGVLLSVCGFLIKRKH